MFHQKENNINNMTTKNKNTKKVSNNTKKSAIKSVSNNDFLVAVKRLSPGSSVANAKFGIVKCTRSAKDTVTGKKMYSVSKSTVAPNRGAYTFDGIAACFGRAKKNTHK